MCKRTICLTMILVLGPVGALTAGELIKINFQLAGAPIPEEYLPDTGQLFGDQGNGYTYGWSQDMSDSTRDRNNSAAPDQRYDTLIHFSPEAPSGRSSCLRVRTACSLCVATRRTQTRTMG